MGRSGQHVVAPFAIVTFWAISAVATSLARGAEIADRKYRFYYLCEYYRDLVVELVGANFLG